MEKERKEIWRRVKEMMSIKSSLYRAFTALISIFTGLFASIFATNLAVALKFCKSTRKLKFSRAYKVFHTLYTIKNNNTTTTFRLRKTLVLFLALLLFLTSVFAIPQTFNIQGKLTDSTGTTLSGEYNMTFRIYDAYTSGNVIWESLNQSTIVDSGGIYNVILYDINTTFGAQYYLGIEIQSDGEMSPRINLTATPYSFRANVSEDLACTDCVDGSDLNDTITLDANMNILGYNFSVNNSDLFVDTTNASVGIGTTGPTSKLDVEGTLQVTGTGTWPTGGTGLTFIYDGATGKMQSSDRSGGITYKPLEISASSFAFDISSGTDEVVINSNGNVGIGTTSPGEELEIDSATPELRFNDTDNQNYFDIGMSGTDFKIYSNDTSAKGILIDQSGNVGIGTTAPAHKLEVAGSMNISGDLNVSGTATITTLNVTGSAYLGDITIESDNITTNNIKSRDGNISFFNDSNNEIMRIVGESGRVGIGTTGPGAKLNLEAEDVGIRLTDTGDYNWDFRTHGTAGTTRISIETAASTEFFTVLTTGNVGINTTIPNALLHINNTGGSDSFRVDDSAGDTSPFIVDNAGNVGIGTTAPAHKLEVAGSMNVSGDLNVSGALNVSGNGAIMGTLTVGSISLDDVRGNNLSIVGTRNSSIGGSTFYVDDTNNRVGIGTTTPAHKLEVAGAVNISGGLNVSGGNVQIPYSGSVVSDPYLTGLLISNTGSSNNYRALRIVTAIDETPIEALTVTNAGRVGIGTTAPSGGLHVRVNDTANASVTNVLVLEHITNVSANPGIGVGILFKGIDNASNVEDMANISVIFTNTTDENESSAITFATRTVGGGLTERVRIDDSGNVGIGTTGPSQLLEVAGTGSPAIAIYRSGNLGQGSATELFLEADNNAALRIQYASVLGHIIDGGGSPEGALVLKTYNSGTGLTEQVRIDNNGNVGIGTTNPTYLLGVADTTGSGLSMNVSGVLYVNGSSNRVGIGTTSPDAILNVFTETDRVDESAGVPLRLGSSATGKMQMYFGINDANNYAYIGAVETATDYRDLALQPNGGNVGIGTTSPSTKLHVKGTTGSAVLNVSNGTTGMYVDKSGRVGIGTTAPERKLHIDGDILLTNSKEIRWDDSGGTARRILLLSGVNYSYLGPIDAGWGAWTFIGAGTSMRFNVDGSSGSFTNAMDIESDGDVIIKAGNVGIGTTTPAHKLEVAGSMNVSGDLNVSGALNVSGNGAIMGTLTVGSISLDEVRGNNLSIVGTRNSSIGGSTFYVDDTNNRVGIGTATPGAKLDVTGSVRINTGTGVFEIWDVGVQRAYIALTGTPGLALYSDAEILLKPNNIERFRIDTTGDVGIGDTDPDFSLEVVSNFSVSSAANNDGDRFIVNPAGNVGIGTKSPGKKLVINGTTEGIMFEPNVASPVINTTTSASNSNITITSSAGSVIIRLG